MRLEMDVKKLSDRILDECRKIIVGKDDCIRLVVTAVFAGGNVLLDDLPGVGKTTLAKTLSKALGCGYTRIQFVPDMLPSDILGMKIFNQKTGDFELRQGPVMTNILLADEINRAIPRTQSALLEAMEEHQVTIEGECFPLPSPFIVLATENPVESESTFRLPVAQMDRFLLSLSLGYPEPEDEMRMLRVVGDGIPFDSVEAVADPALLMQVQEECRSVHVSDAVNRYMVSIVNATRNDPRIRMGGSPRASRSLYQAAKAYAAMNGRSFVTPDDVKALAQPVLGHRLLLESSSRYSGLSVKKVIDDVLSEVKASVDAKEFVDGK